MEETTFQAFKSLIYRESGINLKADKKQLLSARIQKRLRELGLRDPGAYLEIVETDLSGSELTTLLDAVSTNVTFFYREPSHFDFLNQRLKEWRARGKKRARIWCAASSSGQEPYTLAICAREMLDLKVTDLKILATDLSTKVLRQALRGVYPRIEIEKVPSIIAKKYFYESDEEPGHVEVSDDLRSLLTFRQLNLVHHPFPMNGPFDFIFCRNVMIYFDITVRQAIVNEFARLIPIGGYLILSHSESLLGIDAPFERLQNSMYRRT